MGFEIKITGMNGLKKKLNAAAKSAEHALAVQVAKDTEPFVPMLTGSLANRTQIKGNQIIYPGPYARYLYYGKVMVNSATGKGPSHFVDKNGNEVIRFPKGSKLRAMDKNLVFTKSVHSHTQAKWFEGSKAVNREKWARVAKEAITKELK